MKSIKTKLLQAIEEKLRKADSLNKRKFKAAIDYTINEVEFSKLKIFDASLADKIADDFSDFAKNAQLEIDKQTGDILKEEKLLAKLSKSSRSNFPIAWQKVRRLLKSNEETEVLDFTFYNNKIKEILTAKRSISSQNLFTSIKESFCDAWQTLLFEKRQNRELEIIDAARKQLCEELFSKIEKFKELLAAAELFKGQYGRLWDLSTGDWKKSEFKTMLAYLKKLAEDESVKKFTEQLGRSQKKRYVKISESFTQTTQQTDLRVPTYGQSKLTGIHQSDDLPNLLPAEAALLTTSETEILFYKKFAEKKLQTFEYASETFAARNVSENRKRKVSKELENGPFILCIDTSGSMHGTPERVAKTLSLAVLQLALQQNRKCYLISFSTKIETLELTDVKNAFPEILSFLSMSFDGGTDMNPAMRHALSILTLKDYKRADIVVVSDMIMAGLANSVSQGIQKAKKNGTKFQSLVIGSSSNQGVIKEFNENWFYNSGIAKDKLMRKL